MTTSNGQVQTRRQTRDVEQVVRERRQTKGVNYRETRLADGDACRAETGCC